MLYARQWCLHPDDALQEALIDLAHQSTDPRDPVAWLFQTVRCKAMNQSRAEHRRAKHQNLAAQQRDVWFYVDHASDSESSDVQAALDSLPAIEREIVVARMWGHMTFEQISELVDRPVSFVYRRYQQSLVEVQNKLDGQVNKLSKDK